jgi:hypothetical protein
MALRAKLSCHELRLAVDELLAVTASLNANDARLTPDQITRVRTLNAQVIVELRQEQNDRCGFAKSDRVANGEDLASRLRSQEKLIRSCA